MGLTVFLLGSRGHGFAEIGFLPDGDQVRERSLEKPKQRDVAGES